MTGDQTFWITSRAAGIVAMVAASLAVGVGLAFSMRLVGGKRAADLHGLHEALALTTIGAIVVHALTLLGDSFLRPSLADLTIPFVSGYERVWTTAGILAGWSLIALSLAYYARKRIGVARWRAAHRFTALAWLLGLAHALGIGSDAGSTWFLALLAATAGPPFVLLCMRHYHPAPATPRTSP